MEIRCEQKKMGNCIYITILYIFVMVTTHQRFRTEVYKIKKRRTRVKTHKRQLKSRKQKHKDKEAMEKPSYQKAKDEMPIRRPYIPIITLNVNGLNSTIKCRRVAEWIKKQNPTICCLQETHLSSKDKYRLKVKG